MLYITFKTFVKILMQTWQLLNGYILCIQIKYRSINEVSNLILTLGIILCNS